MRIHLTSTLFSKHPLYWRVCLSELTPLKQMQNSSKSTTQSTYRPSTSQMVSGKSLPSKGQSLPKSKAPSSMTKRLPDLIKQQRKRQRALEKDIHNFVVAHNNLRDPNTIGLMFHRSTTVTIPISITF